MKKVTLYTAMLILLLGFISIRPVQAKIWTIRVQNYVFVPDSILNVVLGDTILWQWVEGSHTTTSVTIPNGAEPWDSEISEAFPAYEYVPAVVGQYDYKCTPHAAFGMVGTFTVTNASGVGEEFLASDIRILPNPFTDKVQLVLPSGGPVIKDLRIYDLTGKMVYGTSIAQASSEYTLDLADLNRGIYFIRMRDEQNRAYIKKIIKSE